MLYPHSAENPAIKIFSTKWMVYFLPFFSLSV